MVHVTSGEYQKYYEEMYCKWHFSKTYPSFLTLKEGFFRKPTRPSLPLRKAPPLTPALFNSLYDPFGSPCRGQKPQERGRKPPYSVLGTATL